MNNTPQTRSDYSTLPALHHPYVGGDPNAALKAARAVIEQAIANHPRSLQKVIGPSEIGTACEHCLAAKLAGWEESAGGVAWLPTVGTAVHAWIEDAFNCHEANRNAVHTTGLRYLTEAKVMVGTIGGVEIWGSTDLVDLQVGMTVDWKVVGAGTLRTARRGPSTVYRTQAHLYAKGWNDAGHRVDHVAIAYLPRNAVSLDDAIWWTEPYQPDIAVAALERANRIAANLAALATLGQQAVDTWISSLPRDPECHDCARYADGVGLTAPGHHPRSDDFADLLA